MKRLIVIGLVATLAVGMFGTAEAAKKKKKKKAPVPVAVDQKFYLHDTSCDDPNTMSLTDHPDNSCWYVDSGVLYDVVAGAGLLGPEDLGQSWTASEGVPLTLDATKPITGEISTSSGQCLVDGGCSPAGLGAGLATLDVFVFGDVNGAETELGTFTETYPVAPGQTHTSKIEIKLDPALDKAQLGSLRVLTYLHGAAVGHGVIELENPASFVTVPSFVTN